MFSVIDCTTTLVFAATFLAVALYFATRRDGRQPPGPPLLPVIGNLLSAARKDSLDYFMLLGQKYGDILGLYIGQELTVVLNSFDAINDAFLKKGGLFAQRPCTPFNEAVDRFPGIISTSDQVWKEQRSFTQKALQELCFKNRPNHIEDLILNEAKKLMEKLEGLDEPVFPKQYLYLSSANLINTVLCSKSYDIEENEFSTFLTEMTESELSFVKKLVLTNCFPFLLKLPFDVLDLNMIFRGPLKWQRFMEKRLENNDTTDRPDDFVDLYLEAVKENDENYRKQSFTIQRMKNTTFDLLIAGSDSTATTMTWIMLYLLHNPELEARLHAEIDDVIGRAQPPSLSDRQKMPYMEATIMETLRMSPAAPLGLPHSVPHDVMLNGFLIRKNTSVVANIYSAHRDPKLWDEPDVFRPERFLSEDKKSVKVPKCFIPFSLGRRSCLGETLARMELFLYMTSLLQRFRLARAEGKPLPGTVGIMGAIYNPQPFEIQFIRR